MTKYKNRTTKYGAGRSQKQYHLYVDDELVENVNRQANKNRFFNAAIKEYIENHCGSQKNDVTLQRC